ncbi:MAG: dCTP deaminase [Methanoculleaceae archaeon]
MILSASEIRARVADGSLVIRPYDGMCQQPASYDLRIGEAAVCRPLECTLVHSLEWVEIPSDLAGTLRCRSSYARMGLHIGGGYIDPGFRGQLTLCLFNGGNREITFDAGDRAIQLILNEVRGGDGTYSGRYQDSRGTVQTRLTEDGR